MAEVYVVPLASILIVSPDVKVSFIKLVLPSLLAKSDNFSECSFASTSSFIPPKIPTTMAKEITNVIKS